MARRPRLFVADMPYHIIQRGNNRQDIFFSDTDYKFFLEELGEAKDKHPCHIYGYCLMTNHFHLLVEPKEKKNISLLMKLLGAKYVRYVNKFHGRTGTLWEGRFKCSLIQAEPYFMACLRYIEMNPVRAGMVDSPELYRWSSFRFRGFGEKNTVLNLDPWYNDLAHNEKERQLKYRQFFQGPTPVETWELIRKTTFKGGIVGSENFVQKIGDMTGQTIVFRPQGRPRKDEKQF